MCAVVFEKISLLVVAGGKSSRLGEDKRFVTLGGVTLLENILQRAAAQNFSEIFLCVESETPAIKTLAARYDAKILVDAVQNAGALSGIANGLLHSKNDWSLAVSCDMPFFDFQFLQSVELAKVAAVIPVCGGKKQMLGAFYHKSAAEIFSGELKSGQNKIFDAVKKIPHQFFEFESGAENFFNVNTRADLKLARGRAKNLQRKIPALAKLLLLKNLLAI